MNYLTDTLILLGVAVVVVPIFQALRLGAVLGFLAAGALVGPSFLGVVTQVDDLRHLAELGVVFLLFIIGVEMKPARLWLMRRQVFGLGTLQVLLTGAALWGLLMAIGMPGRVALLVGLGLALSSTAFVLQILAERRDLASPTGRHAFAVLLLQDLAVVPLLAMVPLLAAPDTSVGGGVGLALLQATAILLLVVGVGRYLLRPVLHLIAKNGTPEIFAASGVLLVLGTSGVFAAAGLSMAMGAFVAGLLIADSEYRHQILADIQPFRGFLLGLFFMSVGMSVDVGELIAHPGGFAAALLALVGVKALLLTALARGFGLDHRAALRVGLLLAQSGEFAFVLFGVAFGGGLIDQAQYRQLLLLVALSMAVTPLLALAAERLRRMAPPTCPEVALPPAPHEAPHAVLAGFGRVGRRVAALLTDAGVPYTAIDADPEQVAAGRALGLSVFYGDASRPEVLRAAGVHEARLVIVTLDHVEAAERIVTAMRHQFPQLPIYARGHDRDSCDRLYRLGATAVVSENLESSLQLGRTALLNTGMAQAEADRLIAAFREGYYSRSDESCIKHPVAAPDTAS